MDKSYTNYFNVNFTKRGAIRQLLNRKTIYSLADYSRKVSKKIGRNISKAGILTALSHMQKEGQFQFDRHGSFIVKVA